MNSLDSSSDKQLGNICFVWYDYENKYKKDPYGTYWICILRIKRKNNLCWVKLNFYTDKTAYIYKTKTKIHEAGLKVFQLWDLDKAKWSVFWKYLYIYRFSHYSEKRWIYLNRKLKKIFFSKATNEQNVSNKTRENIVWWLWCSK